MNKPDDIILIACADLHLSERPPVARSAEDDWLVAQARSLWQLKQLQRRHSCPVVIAGDVFDTYREPPSVINLALRELPDQVYTVFGQHDIQNHRADSIDKTAYGVLMRAGKIMDLKPSEQIEIECKGAFINLNGFPWGTSVIPLKKPHDMMIEIAVIHQYLWCDGKGFAGASDKNNVLSCLKQFRGYDTIISGDNHHSFDRRIKLIGGRRQVICNVGGFQRRKSDEKDHRPSVGLLRRDGSIIRHYLDVSDDVFAVGDSTIAKAVGGIDAKELMNGLDECGDSEITFKEAMRVALDAGDADEGVRTAIVEAMERK